MTPAAWRLPLRQAFQTSSREAHSSVDRYSTHPISGNKGMRPFED
ncbi:hypothetical protein RGE_18700 [Rubrivivax gelatinosus IL144]|uniref:Uncharacterized protein n=1 Tax=Rubrivivax gelatinosus (strain NBRC 100245 / IL144) TaxID=983917 RepID=I0HQC4_RUBGI|nr:hypothetical protein RGE_18700 [Rubrivivax gelatinosus IL144]